MEKAITQRIKAICRRLVHGDRAEADILYAAMAGKKSHAQSMTAIAITAPFQEARSIIRKQRIAVEKKMEQEAKKLCIWPRVRETRGFGALSLATLIGETGDLSNYSTHSKLWKRLGLAVIGGERQRRVPGAAAIEHGYNASRRAIVWTVGQCLFKAQSQRVDKGTGRILRQAGPYRLGYDARKELELTRVETKAHAHNRATRYMEKKLVRNLWKAWRELENGRAIVVSAPAHGSAHPQSGQQL